MRSPIAFLLVAPLAAACTPPPETETGADPPLFETRPPRKSKPANVVGGFSIDLPTDTLQPGEESYPCYIFPLELTGPSRVVGGGRLTVGEGMHHGNIVTRPKTGEGFRPCPPDDGTLFDGEAGAIAAGGAVLFASSTQVNGEEWQRFPDGMGYPIKDGFEIVARMHYLNVKGEPIDVAPRYEWFTVDEAKIDQLLGPFAWVLNGWEIPPQSEFTAVGGCNMLGPMHLVHVLPHMHGLGRSFAAELVGGEHDGTRFLDSPGYDPDNGVMLEYDPPLDLSVADGFRFSCTWQNPLDTPVQNGNEGGEMCILFGYSYPIENSYSAVATGESSCVLAAAPTP